MGRGEGFKIEIVDEILREFYDRILSVVSSEFDETRRYLRFFAWLNTWLEKRGFGRIIVTGGFAVEVYTGRAHRTMDIDIVVEGIEAIRIIEELLRKIAERISRGYLLYIEAVSGMS